MTDKSIVTLCVYDQGLIAVFGSLHSTDFPDNPKKNYFILFYTIQEYGQLMATCSATQGIGY
ncbi:hypothetical protein EMIT0215P_140046 [Pseudomonas serboccidentalis]